MRSATTIVIFGASGDLTWRKLVPALYNNFKKGRLAECAHIVGFARRPLTDDSFRAHLREGTAQFSAGDVRPGHLGGLCPADAITSRETWMWRRISPSWRLFSKPWNIEAR